MAEDEYSKLLEKHNIKKLSYYKELSSGLDVLETGILPLDLALGDLGPDGRLGVRSRSIFELLGSPSCGKSSALVQFIKTTYERYGERSVVGLYAEPPDFNTFSDKNVNPEDILARCCFDPDLDIKKNLTEDWLEAMLALAKRPETKLIFIDSVSALVTTSMIFEGSGNREKDIEAKFVAVLANIFNNFLARFQYQNSNAVLCLINHYREQINTTNIPMPGNDQIKTKGGGGIHFLAQKRCLIRPYKKNDSEERHSIEDTKSPDYIKSNFVMFKRKDGAPRSTVGNLSMIDGSYNNEEKLLEYAGFFGTRKKVKEGNKEISITVSELDPKVASSGAWFYVGDEKFQGKDSAIQYLKDNPDVYEKLKSQVCSRHNDLALDHAPDFSTMLDG